MAHVLVAMPVPDIAGALQDDPLALVDLLITLAELDLITGGRLSASVEGHLPVDPVQATTLSRFLMAIIVSTDHGAAMAREVAA